ncbi:MAG TPA: hypothetical protein VFI67_11965 [Sphingomicrobium sp.]|nr:hypothetical protein [Sphingomicrobium sp.]
MARDVGSRQKEHVSGLDPRAIVAGEVIANQPLLDAVGEALGIELALQLPVAAAVEVRHRGNP